MILTELEENLIKNKMVVTQVSGKSMQPFLNNGDKGQTSIIGGRVDKDDLRVEAYGTIDELNSIIGKAVTELSPDKFEDILADLYAIQNELFDAGTDLANVMKERHYKLQVPAIENLEKRIDALTEEAPALEKFILPGGTTAAATLHIARTVARRAERQIVTLMKANDDVPPIVLQYSNRLSDYLFAAAVSERKEMSPSLQRFRISCMSLFHLAYDGKNHRLCSAQKHEKRFMQSFLLRFCSASYLHESALRFLSGGMRNA